MNRTIKNRAIKPEMVFFSDTFDTRENAVDETLTAELSALIDENTATMFTWYTEGAKMRVIVYNFADSCGNRRAGYFMNGRPTNHIYDIKAAILDIIAATWHSDVYIKAV